MKYKFILILLFVNILAFVSASTISNPSVCCEKTISGGICINTELSNCDSGFGSVPTSCETTSFCKLGTCYDSKEGLCLENVPLKVCQANNGTWSEKKANELAQCKLGCCILSDQAAFVTLTRCKSMSTFYGLTPDFRASISSELACIEEANSQDEGACVFYDGGVKTCEFTTRKECGGTTSTILLNASPLEDTSGKRFYEGVLCSAEELGTVCARQKTTGCYKSQVYWFDNCGNRENVYFSDSDASWNKGRVADPDEICAETSDSKTCGNCDYLLGSRCSDWDSILGIGKPKNVNHYCKTTKCTDRDGKERMNGESWCVYDGDIGNGKDPAGSRHYREICVDGKVVVEACEDFRNQICMHSGLSSSAGEYSVSACRVNRWQDCTAQTKKDNCENTDQRDCIWVASVEGIDFSVKSDSQSASSSFSNSAGSDFSNTASSDTLSNIAGVGGAATQIGSMVTGKVASSLTGNAIRHVVGSGVGQWEENELNNKLRINSTSNDSGLCVPMVSPGQEFWTSGDSKAICGQASASCQVKIQMHEEYESILLGALGDKKKTYTMLQSVWDADQQKYVDVEVEETECLSWDNKGKGTLKVNPEWGARANAVCSALGDCGADVNFNGVFTDDGYEWKYKNQSYYFTQADLGLVTNTQLGIGTGEVVAVEYLINGEYEMEEDDYVYVKK